MIFNELIENVEQMKLKKQKQNDIRSFLKPLLYLYSYRMKKNFSILILVTFFCPNNPTLYIADISLYTSVWYATSIVRIRICAATILYYFASESWSYDDWFFWLIVGPI